MLPAGASSWIHGGGKGVTKCSVWAGIMDPYRLDMLDSTYFSISVFAYDSLCMMNRLDVAARKVLGA